MTAKETEKFIQFRKNYNRLEQLKRMGIFPEKYLSGSDNICILYLLSGMNKEEHAMIVHLLDQNIPTPLDTIPTWSRSTSNYTTNMLVLMTDAGFIIKKKEYNSRWYIIPKEYKEIISLYIKHLLWEQL